MGFYRERIFPWLLEHLTSGEKLEEIRDRVVGQASGHVIELGSGTGANFLSYPSSITSLTTIEPNPGMNRRARQRIKYLEVPVDAREISGNVLPMKDASFDCAVSTFALCSISDADACLREIFRVLKPGGRLLFLEHGRSDSDRISRWQHRIAPVQRRVCDGCCPHKDIDSIIRHAGFSIAELNNYYLDGVPRVLGYMFEGMAAKKSRITSA
jgi:ubiquinone/menaquinone biosynthesis C-methylase UbiE